MKQEGALASYDIGNLGRERLVEGILAGLKLRSSVLPRPECPPPVAGCGLAAAGEGEENCPLYRVVCEQFVARMLESAGRFREF